MHAVLEQIFCKEKRNTRYAIGRATLYAGIYFSYRITKKEKTLISMLSMHISENFPDPKLQAVEKPRTLGISLQLWSRDLAHDPFQSQVHAELPVFCTNKGGKKPQP